MKIIKYVLILILGLSIGFTSCESDKEFLNEEPRNFLTSENAYTNKAQFETLIGSMYRTIQEMYNAGDGYTDTWYKGYGMDAFTAPRGDDLPYNDWTL